MVSENEKYKIAFYEVNEIIENMPITLSNKIPKSFKDFIKENKIKEYDFKFTKKDSLSNVELTKEAKTVLSLIYRNYLTSEEKKKELYIQDREIIESNNKKRQEQYSYENLFKNDREKNEEKYPEQSQSIENAMIEYKKENIITKIFNKIKMWFSKKK